MSIGSKMLTVIPPDEDLPLYPPYKQAAAMIASDPERYHYGYVLQHEELYEMMGLDNPKEADITVDEFNRRRLLIFPEISGLHRWMLDHYQLALKSIHGVGYEIVQPAAQTDWAWTDGVDEIKRSFNKMASRLVNTRTEELSDEQRRENTDKKNALARMRSMVPRSHRAKGIK